jgi:hypothetical protein
MLTTSIVNAGHNRLLQEDTNGRKME